MLFEHFEVNQEIYQEEATAYANEGITEAMYVAGCGEHIREGITEDIAHDIATVACDEYERLARKKFKRLKSADFTW